jgi:hypothetical protein
MRKLIACAAIIAGLFAGSPTAAQNAFRTYTQSGCSMPRDKDDDYCRYLYKEWQEEEREQAARRHEDERAQERSLRQLQEAFRQMDREREVEERREFEREQLRLME